VREMVLHLFNLNYTTIMDEFTKKIIENYSNSLIAEFGSTKGAIDSIKKTKSELDENIDDVEIENLLYFMIIQ
jgi:hypothetical protein